MRAPSHVSAGVWAQPAMERCVDKVMRMGNVPKDEARSILQQVLLKATANGPNFPMSGGWSPALLLQQALRSQQVAVGPAPPRFHRDPQMKAPQPPQLAQIHHYTAPLQSPPLNSPPLTEAPAVGTDFRVAHCQTVWPPLPLPPPPPPPPPLRSTGMYMHTVQAVPALPRGHALPVAAGYEDPRAASHAPLLCPPMTRPTEPATNAKRQRLSPEVMPDLSVPTSLGSPPREAPQPADHKDEEAAAGKSEVADRPPVQRQDLMPQSLMAVRMQPGKPGIVDIKSNCTDGLLLLCTTASFVPRAGIRVGGS